MQSNSIQEGISILQMRGNFKYKEVVMESAPARMIFLENFTLLPGSKSTVIQWHNSLDGKCDFQTTKDHRG
jgi:hypothetical protein